MGGQSITANVFAQSGPRDSYSLQKKLWGYLQGGYLGKALMTQGEHARSGHAEQR